MNLAIKQTSPSATPPIHSGSVEALAAPLFDLKVANRRYADATPEEIIQQALNEAERPLISTSFSAYSAALLHIVHNIRPDITVLWCDTGFNTPATYHFANRLIKKFGLNLKIYHPQFSAGYLQAIYGDIPEASTPEHAAFTNTVKLEPFERAFAELKPDLWINGIRREETEFRRTQNIFTWDAKRQVTKVAPIFNFSSTQLVDYLQQHDLPIELDYFDPTKPEEHLECGLHY